MDSQIESTIALLTSKITAKEEEANKLKKLVNELSGEAGLPIPYSNIVDSTQGISNIRSDQFYGQPLTSAMRNYLEMRGAAKQGAASVSEIYSAIRNGGYAFDTKDENNAKNTVRISLGKNSSIFHKLPHGDYGLLAWYPDAKTIKKDKEKPEKERGAKEKPSKKNDDAPNGKAVAGDDTFITNEQIRSAVFATTGNFKASEIEQAIKNKFPSKTIRESAIPTALFILKGKGLVKMISPRNGSAGATYCKV
jgi:hypothetical protein